MKMGGYQGLGRKARYAWPYRVRGGCEGLMMAATLHSDETPSLDGMAENPQKRPTPLLQADPHPLGNVRGHWAS